RYCIISTLQHQLSRVDWQAVKGRTVQAGKSLEPVQAAGGFECRGIELHGVQGGIAARTAAGVLFEAARMRRTVGTQKKPRAVACSSLDQSKTVSFALEYRQAIPVRAHTAQEQRIAVVQQMMRSDGGGDRAVGITHVVDAIPGGQVFE